MILLYTTCIGEIITHGLTAGRSIDRSVFSAPVILVHVTGRCTGHAISVSSRIIMSAQGRIIIILIIVLTRSGSLLALCTLKFFLFRLCVFCRIVVYVVIIVSLCCNRHDARTQHNHR